MKKMLFLFWMCFLLTGCVSHTAKDAVVEYLEKFRNHDKEILNSYQPIIQEENYTEEQKKLFELVMKRQFVYLKYEIQNMIYDGNKAKVDVTIEVYDYNHSKKKALEKKENSEKSLKNLELEYMKKEQTRTKYTIRFLVTLKEDSWGLEPPDSEILEKIEGIFSEPKRSQEKMFPTETFE